MLEIFEWSKSTLLGIVAVIGAIVALIGWGRTAFRWTCDKLRRHRSTIPAKAQNMMPEDTKPTIISQNVTSHNQQGGITAHTVNLKPVPRTLSSPRAEKLKAQILDDFPRDKEFEVVAVHGDDEAFKFAREIFGFLKSNGFKMRSDGVDQVVFVPTIENP